MYAPWISLMITLKQNQTEQERQRTRYFYSVGIQIPSGLLDQVVLLL